MKIQLAKGVKDINPEEKIKKNEIVQTIQKYFELYGYNPLDTPIIERFDVLASKYAGGSEILKETFKLNDQGERDLCLRYDLTVPFARYIATTPTIKLPFKRYQIGQVFRDGPIKAGRFREFTQCDADVVGSKDMLSEAELLKIASLVFNDLKIDVEIKVNNRKVLDAIMKKSGIPEDKWMSSILSLDKIEKIGRSGVESELSENGLDKKMIDSLLMLTEDKSSTKKNLEFLKKELGDEPVKEIESLFDYLNLMNTKVSFIPSLARGLAYYTGTVYEVFAKDSEIKSSIAAGGRYDKMIGDFVRNNQEYPAVGLSFGVDVIFEVVKRKTQALKKTTVKALLISIKTNSETLKLAEFLRENNVSVEINSFNKNISKGLEYASAYEILFVVFIGENELNEEKYKIRDMLSGKEQLVDKQKLVKFLG